jgi:hypothetical protein
MPEVSNAKPDLKKWGGLMAVLLVFAGLAAYGLHQRSAARQLNAQNMQVAATLRQTRAELDGLKARVSELTRPEGSSSGPVQHATAAKNQKRTAIVRVRSQKMHIERPVDRRFERLQSQVDEQGRQIDSTKSDLANTRTELQGSIAKTHDELVLLQKRGERNYFEFDLAKSRQFQRSGPIGVRLRKANTKHQYADLQLMVDDVDLTKKHVNLYEPVLFYTADGAQATELVINSITKDHIRGYISEPKYRRSELAAMQSAASQPTADQGASAKAPAEPVRKKLPSPE